jgi:demethylmenaquinone methyltransferase/2-methoxy-6-polyprenyl-1,4-benzoquinol methylase
VGLVTHETGTLEPDGVRAMFDRIAPVYDAMNRVMTAGLDRSWRRLAARAVVLPGDRVLDACCGTGDLALAAEREGGHVTGLDFSPRMLERARRKSTTIEWVQGDVLALPFPSASFDAATVGFGVRNVDGLADGLAELRRVLRPGGRLAILEITQPSGPLRPFFDLWFDRVVPLLGRVLPGGRAYTYLPASVRRFPDTAGLAALLEEAGFRDVRVRLLGGTIVALHVGTAGAAPPEGASRRRSSSARPRASTCTWPRSRSGSRPPSPATPVSWPPWERAPWRPGANGCARCSPSSPPPPRGALRSSRARRWSSCTWRRSSTTT